ncbi:MAG: L,D-transpeptidase family protein [Ferruginibacter sp.]
MDEKTGESIQELLSYAISNAGKIDDSIRLKLSAITNKFYTSNEYKNIWSHEENYQPLTDSLINFIKQSELYGLFPTDYNLNSLQRMKKRIDFDSIQRKNAVSWAKLDLLLTDACLKLYKDLKFGRLFNDSVALHPDSGNIAKYVLKHLDDLVKQKDFNGSINNTEPAIKGYGELKSGIKNFLDSMDRRTYTYVTYPFKKNDAKDSTAFIKALQKRLSESNCIDFTNKLPDSAQLDAAVRKYQQLKSIKPDGKISTSLVKMMNTTDVERFKRIAITLDRYKKFTDTLPEKFIWVNLPGYYLELWDHDTLALESKVICGKPETRTPLLKSAINNIITYPTWTVPTSIIAKQYLPKLKNNPYYLSRLGLRLVNEKGETINAGSINWAKYSKGIPYKVMQGSGDDNALGVIKFNFENSYAVYLHDTNQRYLFKKSARALSHGCVRVQEWEKLAYYIARNDSLNLKVGDTLRYTADSIRNWIAEKKTKRIQVKNQVPLFINYFSCEGKNGKIKFYEDIYGEDKALREKYFSNK